MHLPLQYSNFPGSKTESEGKPIFCFAHDLRLVNSYVIPRAPVVPNPITIITGIPATATVFTIIYLCAAFFSILVDPASQYLFAFTWEDQQDSPSPGVYRITQFFSQILKADLSFMHLPQNSTLVQYVDDLLRY